MNPSRTSAPDNVKIQPASADALPGLGHLRGAALAKPALQLLPAILAAYGWERA